MTKKKTPKRKPAAKQRGTGRPFKPGQSGNPAGRPKGLVDIRKAAQDAADRAGIDLDRALGDVMVAMVGQAKAGDVPAAKLVFDRLCGPVEPAPVQVNIDNRPPPTEPPGETWAEHFAKIVEVSRGIAPTSQNGSDRGA